MIRMSFDYSSKRNSELHNIKSNDNTTSNLLRGLICRSFGYQQKAPNPPKLSKPLKNTILKERMNLKNKHNIENFRKTINQIFKLNKSLENKKLNKFKVKGRGRRQSKYTKRRIREKYNSTHYKQDFNDSLLFSNKKVKECPTFLKDLNQTQGGFRSKIGSSTRETERNMSKKIIFQRFKKR
mmetsp:Transcript_6293/g.5408  ORF Transcript_6293/g.5408 Transcript_6293/m.5408 type:complete len:182 (+) Transcript_6293:243-788(+)